MSALSSNSNEYYQLTQARDKYTRNSRKYYACTQLIKINKLERKLILEEKHCESAKNFNKHTRRLRYHGESYRL